MTCVAVTIEAEAGDGADRGGGGRRLVWLLAAVAAIVLLAMSTWLIVGDGESEVSTDDPSLNGTAAATLGEGSARVLIDAEDDNVQIEGVMSFGTDGRGRFDFSDTDDPDSIGSVIALPGATYVEFDGFWLEFTNEEFSEGNGYRLGTDRNEFLAIVQLFVEALDHAAPGSVRDVGTDVVRGEAVRVVAAEVDMREAIRSSSVEIDEAAFDESVPAFGSELEVMLDDEGRARRVSLSGGEEDVTIELWDFGLEVEVDAPPVTDEQTLLEDRIDEYDDLREADVASEAEYCALAAEFRPMLTATEPAVTATEWHRAEEQMVEIDDVAPIETMTWTGVLASTYRSVGHALDAGAAFDEVMADGFSTEYGLLDRQTVRDAERGFVDVTASICD